MWAGNQCIWKWCYTLATTVLALSTGPGCYTGETCGSKPTVGHPIDSVWHELGASDPPSEISWCYSWSISCLVDFKSTCITFQSTWSMSYHPSDMLWNIMADLVIETWQLLPHFQYIPFEKFTIMKLVLWWNTEANKFNKMFLLPLTNNSRVESFFIFHELKIICWCLL